MQVLFLCVAFPSGTVFRADWAADSCAGGYIFPFCDGKDTSFPRRTATSVSFVL
jgi:hypothetical protein